MKKINQSEGDKNIDFHINNSKKILSNLWKKIAELKNR